MQTWSPPALAKPVGEGVYVALWLGLLLLAGHREREPFPDEVGELAGLFFATYPPVAKA